LPDRELILIVLAFFTSTLSGVVGLGGGVLLFAAMASFFPPLVLIPLHGVVQLASNVSRAGLSHRHIDWRITVHCMSGAVLGSIAGARAVLGIPERVLELGMVAVMLFFTWAPPLKPALRFRGKFFWVGIANGFLAILVGATGPFLAAFFAREPLKKEPLIATQASCQAFVHAMKVAVYFGLGFALAPYASLLTGMILSAFAGSWFARFISRRVPERVFQWLFRLMITALALRMLWRLLAEAP
jgi:uncharacterized membrane protein YfcA